MKFKWTLFRKIQLGLTGVLLMVFIIMQLTMSYFIREAVSRNEEQISIQTAVLLQKNLGVVFNDAIESLQFLENHYYDVSRGDMEIDRDLFQLTEIKGSIRNAFVIYNDGSFILKPEAKIPIDFDPRTRDYYKAAYESRQIHWSQPYVDMATKELVITSAMYIQFQDIDGVIGVDINLNEIPNILSASQIGETGYSLLVSEDNRIIADSNLDLIDRPLDVINDPEFLEMDLITGIAATNKGTYYLRRINQSNMRLISFLPHSDVSRSVSFSTRMVSVLLLIAFFLSSILTYLITRRIIKPIKRLEETMKVSETSDMMIALELNTNDEINTLITGYNTLAEHVNQQNEELITLSNELIESEKELQKQYDKVSELAYTDHLTGLPNRVRFEEETKRYIRDEEDFAMMYMDLDNFKYINDTYGHNYGDVVLQIISKRIKDCCVKNHFSSRISGDEFAILTKHVSEEKLSQMALKLLETISKPIYYNELEFTITGTIGISQYPYDGKNYEDLLSNADIAVHEAKSLSKNHYLIFSTDLRDDMLNRVILENQLLSAITNDELYLSYQPLIDFKSKKVYGFEALCRWENSQLGFVSPEVFIPLAEKTLLINSIGQFVLDEAIRFGAELNKETGRFYEMNVNVSLLELHQEGFVDQVVRTLEKYHFPSEFLNIELTESVASDSSVTIRQRIDKLRMLGIGLSIDDFGSGYSSLNQLTKINVTHLKIDRLLIVEASKDQAVYQLLRGIVEFAHIIDLKVIAEGIEDKHMEMLMLKMNIDYAQGYLYSKPIRDHEVYDYLEVTKD
ncbi:EAL domain-containing protein [Acidaminobacter sp. JC074]|uniref:bifunctional diguanylate cyclase/phosphodiesterase n=1 Tax=Acidaminobacter sp. JC074 TaxID=2530199 RepID=UPI001F0EE99A|nr:EAL domain-containing protein [Acidaminobacter sp. JC074]MCH4888449.1 EAL domain-containing protein [Acidaminobacter sp. JC074]